MSQPRARRSAAVHAVAVANAAANRLLIPLLNSSGGRRLGRRLAVVEYAGRRTGLRHTLVAIYATDGSTVRINVGMAESKTWWRNFEEPRLIQLRLAGTDHEALAHLVRDGDQVSIIAELVPDDGASGELTDQTHESPGRGTP